MAPVASQSPQAVLTPNPSPLASNPGSSPGPKSSGVVPVPPGERTELARKFLILTQDRQFVYPEDYEFGPILTSLPESGSAGSKAMDAARAFFISLKAGTPTGVKSPKPLFLDNFLAEYREAFHNIQLVRFLAKYQAFPSEAAFSVRLLGINSSARMELFLNYSATSDSWVPSDMQGNPGLLTETQENRYTDYKPQDIERTLIREGHGKPWL